MDDRKNSVRNLKNAATARMVRSLCNIPLIKSHKLIKKGAKKELTERKRFGNIDKLSEDSGLQERAKGEGSEKSA